MLAVTLDSGSPHRNDARVQRADGGRELRQDAWAGNARRSPAVWRGLAGHSSAKIEGTPKVLGVPGREALQRFPEARIPSHLGTRTKA